MLRNPAKCILVLLLLFATKTAVLAADIWYEDNNLGKSGRMPADFVEKFRQPDSFKQASEYMDVYLIRANVLEQMNDEFFTNLLFPYLKKYDVKLAIDASGATWTQANERRQKSFQANMKLLNRIKQLGGHVDYISLQSALSKTLKVDGEPTEYPLENRIEDIVNFAKAARAIFPHVSIGIIDALLSHGKEYREPYRLLKEALDREGIGLSYVHLDISFDAPRTARRGVTWKTIQKLESYLEDDLGVQFGLYVKSRKGGQISSKAFYRSVMASMDCYSGSGGTPRDYIIASWFKHPEKTIPETATGDDYPAMRIVLEFGRELNQIEEQGASRVSQRSNERRWRKQCGINAAN